jgi:hypothetical protein
LAPLAQVQAQGTLLPSPLTAEAVAPAAHSMLAGGAALVVVPLAEPQRPGGGGGGLVPLPAVAQLAVAPPLLPEQVQPHGPLPASADAVPAEHSRFEAGWLAK